MPDVQKNGSAEGEAGDSKSSRWASSLGNVGTFAKSASAGIIKDARAIRVRKKPSYDRKAAKRAGARIVKDTWRSGELPSAQELGSYEKAFPGAGDRVLRMAERALRAKIAARRWKHATDFVFRIFDAVSKLFHSASHISSRLLAQIFAFVLGFVTLAAPVYVTLKTQYTAINDVVDAVIAIVVALGGALVGRSIYFRIGKKKRARKKK